MPPQLQRKPVLAHPLEPKQLRLRRVPLTSLLYPVDLWSPQQRSAGCWLLAAGWLISWQAPSCELLAAGCKAEYAGVVPHVPLIRVWPFGSRSAGISNREVEYAGVVPHVRTCAGGRLRGTGSML